MQKKDISKVSKKPTQPYPVIADAATFFWIGFIILCIPNYLKIVGIWQTVFYIFGAFVIIISIGGAVMGLSNIRKNEGWDYIGSGLILLSPAIISHLLVTFYPIIFPIDIILRIIAIISAIIGGVVFNRGWFYIFWKPAEKRKITKKRGDIKTIIPYIIPLIDPVVKWISKFIFKK